MVKYFISGSTGFIGMHIAKILIANQCHLHLLVRSKEKAAPLLHPGVSLFEGDITEPESVERAMRGCTHVFHLAALARPYADDPSLFDRINIDGTRIVLQAALEHGIAKVVLTSTAGIFKATTPHNDADENCVQPDSGLTDYIRTKKATEEIRLEYQNKGLNIVTVYPSRVFGPGVINESNSLTKILISYTQGQWHIIPGNGKTFGNYVYVDDVAKGHIMAMMKGKNGERYILGGTNATFDELFEAMKSASGKNYILVHVPRFILLAGALMFTLSGIIFGKPPLITPGWVNRYLVHRRLSSKKAIAELDYRITSLKEGFTKTAEWLKNEKSYL